MQVTEGPDAGDGALGKKGSWFFCLTLHLEQHILPAAIQRGLK